MNSKINYFYLLMIKQLLIIIKTLLIIINCYQINNLLKNELIIKAKLCKICYSKTAKFNISKNKLLNIYDNYIFINESSTNSISYIFYNKNKIDVCFKGTSNIKDNYFNFNVRQVSYLSPNVKIHNGFLNKYLSIKDEIMKNIEQIINKNDIKEISVNGHSSGGAMANIATIDIYNKFNKDMQCITFGSPRVGNKEFIDIYNKCVNRSIRIVNWNDIIHYVPPMIPYFYKHVHSPMILNECIKDFNIELNIYKYLKKRHSITRYVKNIMNCN